MQPLRVETLSVTEIQSFALAELADAMLEVLHAIPELGREEISARGDLCAVRVAWRRKTGRFRDADDYEASLEEARAMVDVLRIRRATLRDIKSILQTACKTIA